MVVRQSGKEWIGIKEESVSLLEAVGNTSKQKWFKTWEEIETSLAVFDSMVEDQKRKYDVIRDQCVLFFNFVEAAHPRIINIRKKIPSADAKVLEVTFMAV